MAWGKPVRIGRYLGLNLENESCNRSHDGCVHHSGEQDDASDGVWSRPKSVLVVFYLWIDDGAPPESDKRAARDDRGEKKPPVPSPRHGLVPP
jgi:hypothetical protein